MIESSQLGSMTYPDASSLDFDYNASLLLSEVDSSKLGTFSFKFDAAGCPTKVTRPNSTSTNRLYDAASQLLAVDHYQGATEWKTFDYGYDAVGRRTSITREDAKVDVFGYDAIDQVTSAAYKASNTSGSGAQNTESFTFDPMGNRENASLWNAGNVTYT